MGFSTFTSSEFVNFSFFASKIGYGKYGDWWDWPSCDLPCDRYIYIYIWHPWIQAIGQHHGCPLVAYPWLDFRWYYPVTMWDAPSVPKKKCWLNPSTSVLNLPKQWLKLGGKDVFSFSLRQASGHAQAFWVTHYVREEILGVSLQIWDHQKNGTLNQDVSSWGSPLLTKPLESINDNV